MAWGFFFLESSGGVRRAIARFDWARMGRWPAYSCLIFVTLVSIGAVAGLLRPSLALKHPPGGPPAHAGGGKFRI